MAPPSQVDMLLDTDYGKSSKELIEFVGQLRALGAHIDLELPRIVVIGNQSAGKSSLVEAISGISVPRDAGTCTRCPMECRLARTAGQWSCQIKIRWEFEDDNTRCEEIEEVEFGPLLNDKNEVELMLRRAQAAVLNPAIPISNFLSMTENDLRAGAKVVGKKPLLFSRNVVCMELNGPDLADLSFVDLPGIVQNADAEIVKLVEDLVNSYIKGNSLILVTLPMSDDIENQKAARLAKLADPNGLRTIGVMTKPDTLSSGSTKARDLWLGVIEGRRHPLLHGYYCTRQPDDDERARGISGMDARNAEAEFFKTTAPWAASSHQNKFGTRNLVQNISKLLTQIIRESLPALLGQVALQLESCNAHLDKLPPAITSDPPAFVLQLVTTFCSELTHRVRGSPTNTALVQSTRKTYEAFKYAVRATAPPFVPYKDASQAPKDVSEYIRMDGKRLDGTVMYLEDVRRRISDCVTRELPGNVPYAVKESLIQGFQANWENAAVGCFDDVQKTFKQTIAELTNMHFDRYNNLKAVISPVTAELIAGCADVTTANIRQVLQFETSPFTQNDHYLSDCRATWLAKYKDARAGKATPERVTPAVPMPAMPTVQPAQPFAAFAAGSTPSFGKPPTNWANPSAAPSSPGFFGASKAPASAPLNGAAPSTQPKSGLSVPQTPSTPAPAVGPANATTTQAPSAPTFNFATNAPASVPQASAKSTPFWTTPSKDPKEDRTEVVRDVLAHLAKLGYTGLSEEDLGKLNPPDIYEDELQVMAEVRAYFQIAYKRIIDMIPLSIDHTFLYMFVNKLQQMLYERLELGTANSAARCSSYIAEDPAIVAMRDELLSKKRRLENVQKALINFGL